MLQEVTIRLLYRNFENLSSVKLGLITKPRCLNFSQVNLQKVTFHVCYNTNMKPIEFSLLDTLGLNLDPEEKIRNQSRDDDDPSGDSSGLWRGIASVSLALTHICVVFLQDSLVARVLVFFVAA